MGHTPLFQQPQGVKMDGASSDTGSGDDDGCWKPEGKGGN